MEGAGAMRIDETRPLPQGVDIPGAEIVRESKGNQVLRMLWQKYMKYPVYAAQEKTRWCVKKDSTATLKY